MSDDKIILAIKKKFEETGSPANIPLKTNGKTFKAILLNDGIEVDNLASDSYLPWRVFIETVNLLRAKGGKAYRGNAMNYKLGTDGLPLDSVEGYIAHEVYGKKLNQSIFRRITPISGILTWANICSHEPNQLVLKPEYNN